MFRTLLLVRQTGREMKLLIHPSAMAPVRIGGRPVPDSVGHAVLAFIFLYFVTVSFLTFAMLLTGLDFDSAFSAVVASINNTAHGFGAPGAVHNLHSLTMLQTWICQRRHAARAPGDLQHRRAHAPGLLAQVGAAGRPGSAATAAGAYWSGCTLMWLFTPRTPSVSRAIGSRAIRRFLAAGAAREPHHAVSVGVDVNAAEARDVLGGELRFDLGRNSRVLDEGLRLRAIDVRILRDDEPGGQYGCRHKGRHYQCWFHN